MSFSNEEKYDNIFLDVIQDCKTLPNFLDVLFGFLRRRTDLYHLMTKEKHALGFLPGVAEKMILNAFNNHKNIFNENNCDLSSVSYSTVNKSSTSKQKLTESFKSVENNENKETNKANTSGKSLSVDISNNEEEVYVADADDYNGVSFENYSWSQTITDLDIKILIPHKVSNSKYVKVDIDKDQICVSTTENNETIVVLSGELSWPVKKHEAIWSFDPSTNQVLINLEKVQERWWDQCLKADLKSVNPQKIDCSRSIGELDEEAQAKIHKLMYDNQQKQMGLPTSDEQKINDILKKAWDAEGSPFQGTEFNTKQFDIIGDHSNT